MNPLDIEIARFIQNSDLAYHFSPSGDAYEFAYAYFKQHAREQLSPKAFGRLSQDLSMKNLKGFTKSFKDARHVVRSAVKMRYIVTTLDNEERVSSLWAKLENKRIAVKRDVEPPAELSKVIKHFKFGVIFVPDSSPGNIESLTLYYAFPAPAFVHVLKDVVAAWGYKGEFGAFKKNELVKLDLTITDNEDDQQGIIKLGETYTREDNPKLIKESA